MRVTEDAASGRRARRDGTRLHSETGAKAARAGAAAVAFLTRVPVERAVELGPEDVARAAPLFPLVGAAVGGVAGLAALGLAEVAPPLAAAGVALGVAALLTGALHLDALADTAD